MQKKIIALAVAGLMSGAAFAQSNVTVYGKVDAGYTHSSADLKKTGIDASQWSTSRLGFKGEEDLGGGMKALFTLEYGLTTDGNAGVGASATAATNARTQIVGLSGGFGTVVAGFMNSPGKNMSDAYDSMGGSNFFSGSQRLQGAAGSTMNARLGNAVGYVLPTMMPGLTTTVAYAFAGTPAAITAGGDKAYGSGTDSERTMALQFDYRMGPLGLGYTHHRANDLAAANTVTNNDLREHLFVAMYDFGMVKLNGSYLTSRLDTALAATDTKNKVWSVGAVVPVSAMGKVRVTYAKLNHDSSTKDAKEMSLVYTHDMSKRTTMYAGFDRIGNNSASTVSMGATALAGDNASGYAFGVVHAF